MPKLLKSILGKSRKNSAKEEAEALDHATTALQRRVQRLTATSHPDSRAAA